MKTFQMVRQTLGFAALVYLMSSPAVAQESAAQLQAKFDHENNSVKKAKLLVKLGDAEFEDARRAGKEGDNTTVGFTMEKYRDNVRDALESLKKQHPNGYRQMEMQVKQGIREVEDTMLAAPAPYKPPLQIVRQDLITMDEEMIRLLFPHRPADKPATPPGEKP